MPEVGLPPNDPRGPKLATTDLGDGRVVEQVALHPGTVTAPALGTATLPIRVDPTGATPQPVSASALPLPTGAATSARQDTGNASLEAIRAAVLDALVLFARETTLNAVSVSLDAIDDRLAATLTTEVTDRAARVLGHVVVDTLPEANVSDRPTREVGRVRDRFTGGESLADQPGGAVRTFTFASPVQLVWVRVDGADGRADPFGGTPAADTGIYCEDGVPNPITVQCTTVKVYAAAGNIRVWGFRE